MAIVNAAAGVSYLTNLLCQPENWSDALRGASFRKIGVYPGAQLQKLRKFNRSATPNSILERNLKRSLEKSEHTVGTQLKNSKEIFENSQGAQLHNRFWSVTPVCSKSKRNMERFFEYAARTQLERNSKNAIEAQLVRYSEKAAPQPERN